jgi:flagellar hook-basal body complex protein FliE
MAIEATGAVNAYRAAIERLAQTPGNSEAGQAKPSDFSAMVQNFAESAVEVGKQSEQATAAAAAGKADINSVVLAVAEAELTLNSVVAIRDKVLQAYQQILRMPI